jgi:hypothetical protein
MLLLLREISSHLSELSDHIFGLVLGDGVSAKEPDPGRFANAFSTSSQILECFELVRVADLLDPEGGKFFRGDVPGVEFEIGGLKFLPAAPDMNIQADADQLVQHVEHGLPPS